MFDLPVLCMEEALFRANMYQLLPDFSPEQYDTIYQSVLKNQQMADFQYRNAMVHELDDWIDDISELMAMLDQQRGIIATYHTGSYRILNLRLLKAGFPLVLIVSREVAELERNLMEQRVRDMGGKSPLSPQLIILEAEDPLVIRKTVQLMNRGYYLSIYVDGNSGASNAIDAQTLSIPFLGGNIRVRQGIGQISYLTNRPIYPVLSSTKMAFTSFSIGPVLFPDRRMNRKLYSYQATAALYEFLGAMVMQDPGQWECWRYLHSWIVPNKTTVPYRTIKEDTLKMGNVGRWHLFRHQNSLFLLDASVYKTYPIGK